MNNLLVTWTPFFMEDFTNPHKLSDKDLEEAYANTLRYCTHIKLQTGAPSAYLNELKKLEDECKLRNLKGI
jgi:hypothetical protein